MPETITECTVYNDKHYIYFGEHFVLPCPVCGSLNQLSLAVSFCNACGHESDDMLEIFDRMKLTGEVQDCTVHRVVEIDPMEAV